MDLSTKKKLNTLTLSGLMIGPILGSGIVLLPPMAIEILGDKAIYAWFIIMLLGGIFAWVFAKMSLLAPGNEGISAIIGVKLGQPFRELSANYLTAAVCFGPVAVLFTASDFILNMLPGKQIHQGLVTFILLILSFIVLLMGITAIGKLTLILSSLTALILVAASVFSLIKQSEILLPKGLPGLGALGSTLLLLFWAIVGWEVIGNYIEEVKNPQRTIMRAMKISLFAVVLVYLLSTFALQNSSALLDGGAGKSMSMSIILIPLFGGYSHIILGVIAAGLCYCTLIMILGAVTRQMAARAEDGTMPAFFLKKKTEKSPKRALLTLTLFHCVWIILVSLNIISVHWLVETANIFFLGNALLGLIASLRCFETIWLKGLIAILILAFGVLLAFSSVLGWILLAIVTGASIYKNRSQIRSYAVK